MGKRPSKRPYTNGGIALGRSAGYWVADWRDAGTRKRARLIPATEPEASARAALDRMADARRAVQTTRERPTVGNLWAAWMDARTSDGFSNSIYRANWVALGATFATRAAELITTEDCRAYARARFAAGRAPATVHTELSRLRGCLRWAHDERLIGPPPKIWVPQPGRPRDTVMTPDEAKRLIVAAWQGDPHVGLFVTLLFATSGRHKAILELTWDRIDFDRGIIDLDETIPPDPMHKSWRKGRAAVAMSALARAALSDAYPGRQCRHVIEHGGKRLKSVRDGFANAVARAGLKGITPHTIRHTVATWLHTRVETAMTAQLLGHRDEATTRRIYTHADAETTRPAVLVIDGALAALPEKPPSRAGREASKPKKRRLVSKGDSGSTSTRMS